MFLGLTVFEDEHQVVHVCSCLYIFISVVTTVSIGTYGTRVFLVLFPGSSRPSFSQLSVHGLGNEAVNIN